MAVFFAQNYLINYSSSEKRIGVRWNDGKMEEWKNGIMEEWKRGNRVSRGNDARITTYYPEEP